MFPTHTIRQEEGGFLTLKKFVWLLRAEVLNEVRFVPVVSGLVRLSNLHDSKNDRRFRREECILLAFFYNLVKK